MDHGLPIRKLELYGVDRKTIGWFRSYTYQIANNMARRLSNCLPLVCGVRRSSGPLLFLVNYINDGYQSSTAKMFAGGTSLTACAKDPAELESILKCL